MPHVGTKGGVKTGDSANMREAYILVGTQMTIRRGRVCTPGTYPCLRTARCGEVSPLGLLCMQRRMSLRRRTVDVCCDPHYTRFAARQYNKNRTGFEPWISQHTMPLKAPKAGTERVDKVEPLWYFDSSIGHEQ
jgi:hypothetical protein